MAEERERSNDEGSAHIRMKCMHENTHQEIGYGEGAFKDTTQVRITAPPEGNRIQKF